VEKSFTIMPTGYALMLFASIGAPVIPKTLKSQFAVRFDERGHVTKNETGRFAGSRHLGGNCLSRFGKIRLRLDLWLIGRQLLFQD
jgi:hypothetical protein